MLVLATLCANVAVGANKIKLVRVNATSVDIRLENADKVAGLQFTIAASSGLSLNSLERSDRTSNPSWMVASHNISDSSLNVIILDSGVKSFEPGEGTVARLTYQDRGSDDVMRLSLTNLVAVDPEARYVHVDVSGLAWPRNDQWFVLNPNYPNPFNPSTTISFRILRDANVRLVIYDMTGRTIRTLSEGAQRAGNFSLTWNSTDELGRVVASGVYFARLVVDNQSSTRRLLLAK